MGNIVYLIETYHVRYTGTDIADLSGCICCKHAKDPELLD